MKKHGPITYTKLSIFKGTIIFRRNYILHMEPPSRGGAGKGGSLNLLVNYYVGSQEAYKLHHSLFCFFAEVRGRVVCRSVCAKSLFSGKVDTYLCDIARTPTLRETNISTPKKHTAPGLSAEAALPLFHEASRVRYHGCRHGP